MVAGAAVGAPSRFLVDQYLRRFIKYPYGILIVNILGSFILGLTIAHTATGSTVFIRTHEIVTIHYLVAIGFTGAFTTWSTFTLDLYLAFELKTYRSAFMNLLLSLVLGLSAVGLGMYLAP